jgi:hypothetical protein
MMICGAGFAVEPRSFARCNVGRFPVKCQEEHMAMIKAVEAVVADRGKVRLLQPTQLRSTRRALVVILDEPGDIGDETALISEAAFADWGRPEEDAAWSHLQSAK